MARPNKNSNARLTLNEELLSQHFQCSPKHKFFDGNFSSLLIGIEHEMIIHREAAPLHLMSALEANEIAKILRFRFGFDSPFTPTNPNYFTLGKETPYGYIAIKPDFAFHVLEISFPPATSLPLLSDLVQKTLRMLDEALTELGLVRSESSVVEDPSVHFDLAPVPRLSGYLAQFPPRNNDSPIFYYPHYPALIAATQVHLNLSLDRYFELLPRLYVCEWLAIRRFSRSKRISNQSVGCARTLLYEHSLGPEYALRTIPPRIPTDISSYSHLFNTSPQYFDQDPFFPVRDLSFIRPRPFGTIEFRSACSQFSADNILRVAAFRVAQLAQSIRSSHSIAPTDTWSRERVLQHSATDLSKNDLSDDEKTVLKSLTESLNDIPNDLADLLVGLPLKEVA